MTMTYCTRCVTPGTRPNISFDAEGVCNACRQHEERTSVDWAERRTAWEQLVRDAQAASAGYDCLIPVSGGKDSTWQVLTCLEMGLTPLAVTWKTPGRTPLGQRNLDNLVSLGVDHVDYQVNPRVEARFMTVATERLGVPGLPMHMALFAIPLRLAVSLRIPLVVWGENSAVEYGSTDEALRGARLDAAWLRRFGVTGGTEALDWIGANGLTRRELTPYIRPTTEELDAAGVRAVFLGHFLPWDPVETARVAAAHGFEAADSARTGTYRFADVDDDFISVHHHFKWPKFGFTRSFDNLSLEIRNGRLTRDEAIETLRALGDETPEQDIERWCAFTGMSRARFGELEDAFRNPEVWTRRDGIWQIDGFIVPDRRWT
jgi:N-acetyl sugar amidotransferase